MHFDKVLNKEAETNLYTQSGNKGPSYTIFSGYKAVEATERTKRNAWKVLRRLCDPYLLVISYETTFKLGVGKVLKTYEEAKKRTACDRENGEVRRAVPGAEKVVESLK